MKQETNPDYQAPKENKYLDEVYDKLLADIFQCPIEEARVECMRNWDLDFAYFKDIADHLEERKTKPQIFRLKFKDQREDFAQARNQLHILQSYNQEYDDFNEITEIEEIIPEKAKNIRLKNNEYTGKDNMPEYFSLYNAACGYDFCIIGSTDWS